MILHAIPHQFCAEFVQRQGCAVAMAEVRRADPSTVVEHLRGKASNTQLHHCQCKLLIKLVCYPPPDEPVRIPGLVASWPACSKWQPPQGLQHLQRAGEAHVQVGTMVAMSY